MTRLTRQEHKDTVAALHRLKGQPFQRKAWFDAIPHEGMVDYQRRLGQRLLNLVKNGIVKILDSGDNRTKYRFYWVVKTTWNPRFLTDRKPPKAKKVAAFEAAAITEPGVLTEVLSRLASIEKAQANGGGHKKRSFTWIAVELSQLVALSVLQLLTLFDQERLQVFTGPWPKYRVLSTFHGTARLNNPLWGQLKIKPVGIVRAPDAQTAYDSLAPILSQPELAVEPREEK